MPTNHHQKIIWKQWRQVYYSRTLAFESGWWRMRPSLFGFAASAFLCLAASLSVPLHADTLLSENFNGLTTALGVHSAGAFSTINGTNVDIVGPGNGYGYLCASPAGGNCIDLDGTGGNPQGQLQSNMQFGIGTYLLSFNLIGDERGSTSAATVTFGDYAKKFVLASTDTTTGIVTNQLVTLTSPGYLLFASNDAAGSEIGPALDNVSVSTVPAVTGVTPEPSGLVLLGTGLLGVTGIIRKRFAQ